MCGLFPFFPAPDAHHPLCTILFCLPETELGSDVVWPAQAQNGEMTRVQTHTRRISFGTGVEAASMTFGAMLLARAEKSRRCPVPLVRVASLRSGEAERSFHTALARLFGSLRWGRKPPAARWCGGVVGLRVWREHVVLPPVGPCRATCVGPKLAEARAVDRWTRTPDGRVRERVLS